MIILERVLTLSDEQLFDLLSLVSNGKNKNERWEAFARSPIKGRLEVEYEMKKTDFLISGGIEAISREFLSSHKATYSEELDAFRELLVAKVAEVKEPKSTKVKEPKSTNKKGIVLIALLLVAGAIGGGVFWQAQNETKTVFLDSIANVDAESELEVIEKAIQLAEKYPSIYSDDDTKERYKKLLLDWRKVADGDFLSPTERDLYEEVARLPYENYGDNMEGYKKLTNINPANSSYQEKYQRYKSLFDEEQNYLASMSLIPNSYSLCNRAYGETSRIVTSTSTESPSLNYNIVSGKVSIKPGDVNEYKNTITSTMDDDVFYKFCASGARSNPRTPACPYYMECVSAVYHKKNRLKGAPKVFGFERVAKILRDHQIDKGYLKPSVEVSRGQHAYGKPNLMLSDVRNFKSACDVVSSTYSGNVVAAEIYKHVPEVRQFSVAQKLGEKAVKGYGICNCVLQNHTGINQVMSIGYCVGDRYVDY
jgi:hypothetical protein